MVVVWVRNTTVEVVSRSDLESVCVLVHVLGWRQNGYRNIFEMLCYVGEQKKMGQWLER